MTPTRAKVLLGLAVPGTLLGTYIVWYATARGMYKPTDALQGALIGAFGGTVLLV
ncbi:MAG: hypothetical protein NT062_27535 [Proteobacteria bacterium]|nr:hypothetical protein [Pseudomonadota bacterium]